MRDTVVRPRLSTPVLAIGLCLVWSSAFVFVELALRDVQNGGLWQSEPSLWSRYDRPWHGPTNPAGAELIGTIQVAYGTPTKYEITLYRVTVTRFGTENGWTVESLTDEALGFGGLLYAVIGLVGGLGMVAFSIRVLRNREGEAERRAAMGMFGFSILYLFLLFAVLLAERGLALASHLGL